MNSMTLGIIVVMTIVVLISANGVGLATFAFYKCLR
jgi:hypothetical protein